jgi:GTP-binding protein
MSVEFVRGAVSPDQFPTDGFAEIAFVGRSNVGKSSLLNALLVHGQKQQRLDALGRGQMARTSRTPGRTQSVNFYRWDGAFYLVDLPGYGYAKISKQALAQWRRLAESYLLNRSPLRLVVLIIDLRHGATPLDEQMKQWLEANGQAFVVVASKADKVKAAQKARAIRSVEEQFGAVLPFSAKTGEGVKPLWERIRTALEQH